MADTAARIWRYAELAFVATDGQPAISGDPVSFRQSGQQRRCDSERPSNFRATAHSWRAGRDYPGCFPPCVVVATRLLAPSTPLRARAGLCVRSRPPVVAHLAVACDRAYRAVQGSVASLLHIPGSRRRGGRGGALRCLAGHRTPEQAPGPWLGKAPSRDRRSASARSCGCRGHPSLRPHGQPAAGPRIRPGVRRRRDHDDRGRNLVHPGTPTRRGVAGGPYLMSRRRCTTTPSASNTAISMAATNAPNPGSIPR